MQDNLFEIEKQKTGRSWFDDAIEKLKFEIAPGWPDAFGDALHKYTTNEITPNIRTLSLFSGGGGLDIGFHDAGFNILECNELESKFAKTLEKNTEQGCRLSGSKIICQDIHDYHPEIEKVDFIIGGPPCQTFSAAGARAAGVNGTDDVRGNLFLEYARLLKSLKPTGFLFENVYRIIGAQQGTAWKSIQNAFTELGYTLHWRILDAADYGAPQFRERLFIVGLREGDYSFPRPTHGPDSIDCRPYYTAGDAILDIKSRESPSKIGGRHGHLLDSIPPGLNYSFYTDRMGHPDPIFGWRSKFSDYLYKADPEMPVRTIKAQGGQYTGPFSWENRPFSTEELKRLQTFPDDYEIVGNRQCAIHQIGNSVPPQIGRILALSIMQQVFNVKFPFRIDLMDNDFQLGFRTRKSRLTKVYAEKAKSAIELIKTKPANGFRRKAGTMRFSINSKLRFQTGAGSNESDEHIAEYKLNKTKWEICVSPAVRANTITEYEVVINTGEIADAFSGSKEVRLISNSDSEKTILATWKVFEHFVQKYTAKDDLIQAFGYYQYKRKGSFRLDFKNKQIASTPFWRVVGYITNGLGVGEVVSLEELSFLFGENQETVASALKKMKDLGYEIRNHRTNPQIPAGKYLVPYSFPTLNERSLQRCTTL